MAEEPIQQPDQEPEAPAEAEALSAADREALEQMEASAEEEAEAPVNPIAQILAAQKAQLAEKKAPGGASRIAQIAAEKRAQLAAAQDAQATGDQQAQTIAPVERNGDDETLSAEGGSGSGKRAHFTAMTGPLKKLSITHLFLLVNTLAVVALVVSIGYLPFRSSAAADNAAAVVDTPTTQKTDETPQVAPGATEKTEITSWKRARAAFGKKEYALAFRHYSLLYKIARNSPVPDIVAEFFQLRMAQCHEQLAKPLEAQKLFQMATASESPVIRGVANYHIAMSEERGGRYLRARRRAYLAAAALAGLTDRLALETNCAFLIARTLTGSALSFYGKVELVNWDSIRQADPFAGLDEGRLRKLLDDGVKESVGTVLGAKVQRTEGRNRTERWTVACQQTPLTELLSRFATEARTDLRWVTIDTAVRNRPVSLYVRGVTGQRLCELAIGSAGLIARFTGDAIDIYDPAGCESLNQQRDLLVSEAIVVWRRLFLQIPHDERIADGHFALALLQECSGDVVGAIGEYRSMAHKFNTSRLAPQALLEGAKLRIGLRDYSGARKELLVLLDTYPDSSKSVEAYASLGEATMKAGRSAEAFLVFKRLFFLTQAVESRLSASLGAGKCLYEQGKYDAAVKWLGDHISLVTSDAKGDLSQAYLLLGRCYVVLGKTNQAVVAYQSVLAVNPKPDERIEACLSLASVWRGLGNLPRALSVSLQAAKEVESGERKYRAVLITAGIYREMGLPDRGASFISGNIIKVSDRQMQAKLRIEQARCYRDSGRFSDAYDILTKAPEMLSPGRDAQEAACDLADVCLQIGRPAQAVVVAVGVLKSSPVGLHHKRARKFLTAAYLVKQEYENAATTLSGMPIDQLGAKQK